MPHLSLKKLQRGPILKIMISILKIQGDNADMQTEEINVDGKATVMFKFKWVGNQENIISSIRMKKIAGSPNVTVINIDGYFNEKFCCSDKWVEAEMKSKAYYQITVPINGQYTMSYFIEVNIAVHQSGSVLMVPNYKLYKDTEFTDFELQAIDGNVAVHKTILLAQSDVFMAIMRGEWKEKKEGHLKIDGVTVQTLQHLKDYMYLGILPDEGLESLLVVATRYLIDELVSHCIRKLVQLMKPEDFDSLVKLACQHNIPGLVRELVLRIPDATMNDIHQLQISDQESKDKDQKSQPNA